MANSFSHGALALRFARVIGTDGPDMVRHTTSRGGPAAGKYGETEMEGIEDLLEDFELED
jgi:hypothetical protein